MVIVVVLVVALVIAGLIVGHRIEQKRLQALASLAASLGWTFDPSRNRRHDDEYGYFSVFRQGSNRYASNTLRGTLDVAGIACAGVMGDFHYERTTSNGKTTSTQHYRFSYLILELPLPHVPPMRIRREHVLDKLAGAIGLDDIDFESAEFSRRFHVSGRDKRFVYDVITPAMMEFLMPGIPGAVSIERGRLLLTDGVSRWDPVRFRAGLDWAVRFFENWPRHVVRSLADAMEEGRIP